MHDNSNTKLPENDRLLLAQLKEAVAKGENWYLAILKTVGSWQSVEEEIDGRKFMYLIENEAFQWLLLAERLLLEISERVPTDEVVNFLFFDRPPLEVNPEEFRSYLGPSKYKAYLNFLYGVLVEDVLLLAATEEARKERRAAGMMDDGDLRDIAYRRVYRFGEQELLANFRKEKGRRARSFTDITEMAEFAYFRFKHRTQKSEKPKVASDTRRALALLNHYWQKKRSERDKA